MKLIDWKQLEFTGRYNYRGRVDFGSQNGDGQYHKNCYTIGKLRNIFKKLDFDMIDESYYKWPRGDVSIIRAIGQKR